MRATTIREWNDLRWYGIAYLTSESDGIGLRLLCDVSATGLCLLSDFFGLAGLSLYEPMNPGNLINYEKPIASILLPRSMFEDLAIFCILQDWDTAILIPEQHNELWDIKFSVTGYTQEEYDRFIEKNPAYRWKRFYKDGNARNGFRNQSEIIGRIE